MPDTRLYYTCRQACNVALYCFWTITSGTVILLASASVWLEFAVRACAWPFAFCLFHRAGRDGYRWADWTRTEQVDFWSRCYRKLYSQASKTKKDYSFRRKNRELHLENRYPLNRKREFSLSRASLLLPSSSSLLIKLPPELRNMIYENVFPSHGLIYLRDAKRNVASPPQSTIQRKRIYSIFHGERENWRLTASDGRSQQLALAMVCRQTYIETIGFIYSKFLSKL